jgi:hypothetical protein
VLGGRGQKEVNCTGLRGRVLGAAVPQVGAVDQVLDRPPPPGGGLVSACACCIRHQSDTLVNSQPIGAVIVPQRPVQHLGDMPHLTRGLSVDRPRPTCSIEVAARLSLALAARACVCLCAVRTK